MTHAKAKEAVKKTLGRPEMASINFTMPIGAYESTKYGEVKKKVEADKIGVKHVPKLGNNARYRYTHDLFRLGFDSIEDKKGNALTDREALIVHESTHAIQDIAGKTIKMKDSEAAAFIAQCLYFYHRNAAALSSGKAPTFAKAVLREAWDLAMKAKKGPYTYKAKELEPLYKAIVADPDYASKTGDVPYDKIDDDEEDEDAEE